MFKRITLLALICLLWGCTQSNAEPTTASLILYSGMPDPTWELTDRQVREFTRRMETLPLTPVGEETSYLGYRGIYVFLGNVYAPSQTVRVTDGVVIVREGDGERWYFDRDRELERWLLETGQPHVKDVEYAIALNSFSTAFSIYLREGDDILAAEPLISMADVVRYDPETYELSLTDDAFARYNGLQIPVQGLPFVVTVHDNVVYEATFCTPISSMSNAGIVIQWWPPADEPVLRFQLGYPESPELFEGEDLRNATEILDAFRFAGKLEE